MPQPIRHPWLAFPPVAIHAEPALVKAHPDYAAAKAGDAEAAARLVATTYSSVAEREVMRWAGGRPAVLVPVHAVEEQGVNAIPVVLAEALGQRLGWAVWPHVMQVNAVGHTGASGFARLARQAHFEGPVPLGSPTVLVDDFVGQGGTLANLRGHLIAAGADVMGATVLTGKTHSAGLALQNATLEKLRRKHGESIEQWWFERFGHAFDSLTESEAGYLTRTPDADRVRSSIAAEERGGDPGAGPDPSAAPGAVGG